MLAKQYQLKQFAYQNGLRWDEPSLSLKKGIRKIIEFNKNKDGYAIKVFRNTEIKEKLVKWMSF